MPTPFFTNGGLIEEAQAFYRQLKDSVIAHGRSAAEVGIYPGIGPIVGATQQEAEAKYQAIRNLVTIEEALLYLGRFFDHHDFSAYPLDEPFPELGDIGRNKFPRDHRPHQEDGARKGLTLREVALDSATPRTAFIGTAEHIADEIIRVRIRAPLMASSSVSR